MDLLLMLDVFTPIRKTMEAVQSASAAPWKPALYIRRLINHLKTVDVADLQNVPLFSSHIHDVRELKFKGIVFDYF